MLLAARPHGAVARAIAAASDQILDYIEVFTRAVLDPRGAILLICQPAAS